MEILLIGVDKIGGTAAVFMKEAGYPVKILCKDNEEAVRIREEGIRVTGILGEHRQKFITLSDPSQIYAPQDIVMLCTDYRDLKPAAKSILPMLNYNSIAVAMQSSMCTPALADVVGSSRTAGCVSGYGISTVGDYSYKITSRGIIKLGMEDGSVPSRMEYLRQMYYTVMPTMITDRIEAEQYSMLIINSCISGVSGITGKPLGQLLSEKHAKALFLQIAREAMFVADAMGLKVPKYGSLLDYRLLMLGNSPAYNAWCESVITLVGKTWYKNIIPSTLETLFRGEKTQIDMLNGYFVQKGIEYGEETPANELITEMIHEIEDGKRFMTMRNLYAFDSISLQI